MLAHLALSSVYVNESENASSLSERALVAATGYADATTAALRARHMVCSGAANTDERERLADQMLVLADQMDSSANRILGYSWRIDARFARGDLRGVAADLENLDWWVRAAGGPTARWHLLRYRAALAQARGEFPELAPWRTRRFRQSRHLVTPRRSRSGWRCW
ncbi:hypothetical protein GCM10029964_088320 [Kibdelosporangium lantanae]